MKKNNLFLKYESIILFLFYIISIVSIYSFQTFLPTSMGNLVLKQSIYYLLGIILIFIIYKLGIDKILKYSYLIYFINIILLLLVLIFGSEINGAKAWFVVPFIGSFQPSEFMKIGIILIDAKILKEAKIKSAKDELKLIIKLLITILIPAILTFLEPDTGAVIVYFVIFIIMLILSGIRYRWFSIFLLLMISLIGSIFYLYFYKPNLFIEILGNSFFYRLDRIFDWQTSSGMQLENSLITIFSSNIFGNGVNNIPIYYPEGQTDFIFTSFASCFGLIGMLGLIIIIIIFDFILIKEALYHKNKSYKIIIMGFVSVLIYQQIQNISMTIGLLPITGITLPFISYGGSSLISFMILLGIVFSFEKAKNNKKIKYNKKSHKYF